MRETLRQLFKVVIAILAFLGAFFVLIIIFVPKSESGAVQPTQNVVLMPTVTSAPQPTSTNPPVLTRTPDISAVWLRQIEPWFRDVLTWAERIASAYESPGAELDADLAMLELQGNDLMARLRTMHPPPRHLETQEHITESMQSCIDAIGLARKGDITGSNIMGGTCTIGLTLMLDVIGRD